MESEAKKEAAWSLLRRLTMRMMVPEDYMSCSCSEPLLAYKLFYGCPKPVQ